MLLHTPKGNRAGVMHHDILVPEDFTTATEKPKQKTDPNATAADSSSSKSKSGDAMAKDKEDSSSSKSKSGDAMTKIAMERKQTVPEKITQAEGQRTQEDQGISWRHKNCSQRLMMCVKKN